MMTAEEGLVVMMEGRLVSSMLHVIVCYQIDTFHYPDPVLRITYMCLQACSPLNYEMSRLIHHIHLKIRAGEEREEPAETVGSVDLAVTEVREAASMGAEMGATEAEKEGEAEGEKMCALCMIQHYST